MAPLRATRSAATPAPRARRADAESAASARHAIGWSALATWPRARTSPPTLGGGHMSRSDADIRSAMDTRAHFLFVFKIE
eukprot:5217254-Pyramimonas_sp.AAC.1